MTYLSMFRDEKIERERREKDLKDMAECSFAPTLSRDMDQNNNFKGQSINQSKTKDYDLR